MKQDREAYAEAHRAERVSHLNDLAARYREKAEAARQAAKVARWRSFRSQEAAFHRANAQSLLDQAARFEAEARAIETDAAAMGLVEVRPGYDWARLNSDVEPLAPHAVSSGDRSALTGTDHPPSIDRTRVYGVRHGLRAPLAQHQVELENAMPRDAGGTPVRGADPRSPYFKLVNDGGPAMDPTRGINCQDCVLSFFETYVHGRPRVSAPRTFDAYQDGDPDQPSGGEQWGTERAELVTGGRFQSLCDDVSREHPVVAKRKVDQAFADIERQLRAGGPGSFAFIVNAWESGSAHAWCAINQGGQILFVDPQVGDVAGAGMPGRVPTLYGHSGVPRRSNVVRIDALVVNSQGVAMDFANAPDGAWHVQNKTLPPLPPPPVPPSLSTAPDSGAHPVATSVSSPVPAPSVNSVSPAPGLDRSTSAPGPQLDLDAPHPAPQLNLSTPSPKPRLDLSTPPPAPRSDFGPPSAAVEADRSPASSPAEPSHPSPPPGPPVDRIARALDAGPLMALSKPRVRSTDGYDAAMRKGYFGYQRHAREHHEQTRRDELTSHLNTRAENCLSDAAVLDSQARQALRDGWMMRAERLAAGARDVRQSADSLRYGAERVRSGDHVPDRVDVDGPDWARINDDVGALAIGPVETGDRSGITDDVPPSIDHSRRYGVRGGLRVPLAMHQTDLERAMPRDAGGRPVRHADPRLGDWFGLANDGGPEADPTRGINCVDGVLALFDTYMHGRPRVSAPRTFDAYAYGDTNRPLDAEAGGLARIENTVRGEFQGMCPYVGDIDHAEAAQAVDTAMTNLTNHLHNLGHGAFAFIVTDSEGGPAHAWCAVNQNGTILFLDPQTRRISENAPLYRNHGVPSEGNIVSMDALVVNGRGEYAALPYHKAGLWSRSSLEPTAGGVEPSHTEPPPAERASSETVSGGQPDLSAYPASDRHTPPGPGYFTKLYAHFARQNFERKYLESLHPEQRGQIRYILRKAAKDAQLVHHDLVDAVDSLRGLREVDDPTVVDIEHRVKTAGSLARAWRLNDPASSQTLENFLNEQKDLVRFSVQVSETQYADQVAATLGALRERGYTDEKTVSFWRGDGRHNGLNVSLRSPTGSLFEIQFPTKLSRSCGKLTHQYYEVLRLGRETPIQLRVDAFLRMIAINDRAEMAAHLPAALGTVHDSRTVNTTFAKWWSNDSLAREEYARWLEDNGLTLDEVVRRHGLNINRVLGTERLDGNDGSIEVRLQNDNEIRRNRGSGQHHGPSILGRPDPASRHVARAAEDLDVRAGDRGRLPQRLEIHESGDGGRPGHGRTNSTRDARLGVAESRDARRDVRGGRTDGLGTGTAGGVAPDSNPHPAIDHPGGVRPASPGGPAGNPPHHAPLIEARRDVIDQLAPRSPALADIVVRLLDDHVLNEHRLNLTTGLLDPARRPRLIGILAELGEGAALRPHRQSLADFLARHPGVGALFATVGADVNLDGEGRSRKQRYVDATKAGDPARTVGPQPSPAQFILVEDYAATLASRVFATVIAEVRAAVAGSAAHVSGRVKDAAGLIDKVVRMTSGSEGRPPRPEFRVGDIIDAVGTRITVPDMATLSAVFQQVREHFGTGHGGRIVEIENMYAQPKSKNPDYRVITLTIAVDVDGKPYTFELQLTTERASVAADLEHNTIYKTHIPISQRQRRTVRSVMREAAALDQRETVTHE